MPTYSITHITEYAYSAAASLSYNEARMVPRAFKTGLLGQTVHAKEMRSDPVWRDSRLRLDSYGNPVLYFTVRQPHQRMQIEISSVVEVVPTPGNPVKRERYDAWAAASQPWETVAAEMQLQRDPDLLPALEFLLDSPLASVFDGALAYGEAAFRPGRPVLAAVRHLMRQIFEEFEYKPGSTDIYTSIGQVYATKSGVCQDFAHFMLACLRARGLAARYVSGYIETLPRPGQEKLQGADASHAWVSVYVPGIGWIDFDPTNDLIPYEQHITVAWGRDFSDVTPLKGIFFGGGEHELSVSVNVDRWKSQVEEPQENGRLASLN